MPAGVMPGSVPQKFGSDVKTAEASSESAKVESPKTEVRESEEKGKEADYSEDDLKALEEKKSVPYSRFKEVNETKKALAQEKEELLARHQTDLATLAAQYEAKIQAQGNSNFQIEYEDAEEKKSQALMKKMEGVEQKLAALEGRSRQSDLRIEMDRLEKKYPEMDRDAVLGWHHVLPKAELEELAEKSHNDNIGRVTSRLSAILEDKKKKQTRQGIPITGTGIKLKDNERPKTLREASRMARQFFSSE